MGKSRKKKLRHSADVITIEITPPDENDEYEVTDDPFAEVNHISHFVKATPNHTFISFKKC